MAGPLTLATTAPGAVGIGGRQQASNDAGQRAVFIAPSLLTDDQAAALWGVSVRRFHELRDEPWAPAAITLGSRLLRWSRAELEAAIVAMPRADKRGEPAQLARARIDRIKAGGAA